MRVVGHAWACLVRSEMVTEHRNQKNDGNGNADEVQKYGSHSVSLYSPHVIALPPADGGGIAGAKRAHQER